MYIGKFTGVGIINVIAGNYECISDVFNSFDFRFLQTGLLWNVIENKFQYVVHNSQAWSDLLHSIIRIQPKIKVDRFSSKKYLATIERIKKYIARGFRDCTEIGIEAGLLNRYCKEIHCESKPKKKVIEKKNSPAYLRDYISS